MASSWIRNLALPLLLATLLAACQAGPNPRSYARAGGQDLAYAGCGYDRCAPRRLCPPGHILVRIPYGLGGPGRLCKPYRPGWSSCGWSGPQPCARGYARGGYVY